MLIMNLMSRRALRPARVRGNPLSTKLALSLYVQRKRCRSTYTSLSSYLDSLVGFLGRASWVFCVTCCLFAAQHRALRPTSKPGQSMKPAARPPLP
jgi:hypothetical protein